MKTKMSIRMDEDDDEEKEFFCNLIYNSHLVLVIFSVARN